MKYGLTKKEQKELAKLEQQFSDAGGRGVELAERIDELVEKRDLLKESVETYEKLLVLCDGGKEDFTSCDAQTVMVMFDNSRYRTAVMKEHEKVFP